MRMRRKPGIIAKLEAYSGLIYIENKDELRSLKGNWSKVFGNDQPLYVELGTGKGDFLSEVACRYPHINFVGVEKVPEIVYAALNKIQRAKHGNTRLMLVDVENLLFYFQPGEIQRIHLNFSDPWPKKRHEKRRLTHPRFLKVYQELLVPSGQIHLKTDNRDFFEYSLDTLAQGGFSLQRITYNLHREDEGLVGGNIMTEYEKRFASLGQPICRCEAIKSGEV